MWYLHRPVPFHPFVRYTYFNVIFCPSCRSSYLDKSLCTGPVPKRVESWSIRFSDLCSSVWIDTGRDLEMKGENFVIIYTPVKKDRTKGDS